MEIKTGYPVILANADALDNGLEVGDKGSAANLINVEGDKVYLAFHPIDTNSVFIMDVRRFRVDEVELAARIKEEEELANAVEVKD